jgi:hypothetical protein
MNKGPDRVTMLVDGDKHDKFKSVDEIKQYFDFRYVSPSKAVWRIFVFNMHQNWPHVLKLKYHFHKEQYFI